MSGISSKAAGSMDNNYKFNSSSELNNDLDIGLYETPLRGYDMQIGGYHMKYMTHIRIKQKTKANLINTMLLMILMSLQHLIIHFLIINRNNCEYQILE